MPAEAECHVPFVKRKGTRKSEATFAGDARAAGWGGRLSPNPKSPANPRLTLRNACTTITTKRHRRRASAPAPRRIAASRVSAPFRKDIDNRIMKPRSAGGTTQDRGRGRFQTRPCPHGPRRCPPEVEDRLGRNADRQPGHCGIVAQVLGCGRMTPAPTSKPDGHPQDVRATLVVALAPRGLTVQGPSESRKHPADV